MCRWLAYSGPPLILSDLLMRPDHSLIAQSRRARQSVETTNADGFGVGWYGERDTPGVYRDTHPAWNNANFQHLAEHIRSGMFLATSARRPERQCKTRIAIRSHSKIGCSSTTD